MQFQAEKAVLHLSKQDSMTRKINTKVAYIATLQKALAHFQGIHGASPEGVAPVAALTGPPTGGGTASTTAPNIDRGPGRDQASKEHESPPVMPPTTQALKDHEGPPALPSNEGHPDGTGLTPSRLAEKTLLQTQSVKSLDDLI